jgi:hypothetical protein
MTRFEIEAIVDRRLHEQDIEARLNILRWAGAAAILLIAWAIKESLLSSSSSRRFAYYD